MKVSLLPAHTVADGTEEIVIVSGPADDRVTGRMAAGLLADAATKPTPDELKAAILNALVQGDDITFTTNADGTVGVAVASNPDFKGVPTADTAAPGTSTRQIATTAFVDAVRAALTTAINGKQGTLVPGANIDLHANGDGTFTIASTATGGGGGLTDGVYGDVTVSGGGTVLTVTRVTNGTVTVPDEVYGAAWQTKLSVPTKNAVYNQIEAVKSSKVSTTAVGAASGVASLDATGKVPAAQLPSYVDDVLEFSNSAAFPNPGETGKIYVALDTSAQWRWSGTAYVQLIASPGTTDNVVEGSTNKYYTDTRVRAAVMTGLVSTAGTPVGTDSLLTTLGKLYRQAFTQVMPYTGGAFTGAITVTGTVIATSYVKGSQVNVDDGNNGGYIYLGPTGNYYIHFDGTNYSFGAGAATQVVVGGVGLNNFGSAYGVGVTQNRAGQVGYHFYNGGSVCEWLTYQPAHASGDEYRIATYVGGVTTDRLKIGADGNVTVPGNFTTHDVIASRGDGTGVLFFGSNAANNYLQWDGTKYNMPGGALVVGGNITSSSDRRLKRDIRALTGAREILSAIGSYRFTMRDKASVGVIAQEVEEVLPELVETDGEGMLSVDYGKLAAVLIADNNAMAERLAVLEAMVAKLAA